MNLVTHLGKWSSPLINASSGLTYSYSKNRMRKYRGQYFSAPSGRSAYGKTGFPRKRSRVPHGSGSTK